MGKALLLRGHSYVKGKTPPGQGHYQKKGMCAARAKCKPTLGNVFNQGPYQT